MYLYTVYVFLPTCLLHLYDKSRSRKTRKTHEGGRHLPISYNSCRVIGHLVSAQWSSGVAHAEEGRDDLSVGLGRVGMLECETVSQWRQQQRPTTTTTTTIWCWDDFETDPTTLKSSWRQNQRQRWWQGTLRWESKPSNLVALGRLQMVKAPIFKGCQAV